jgi:hypothetical protein
LGNFSKIPDFRNTEPTSVINKVSAHLVVFPDAMNAYQSGSCCRIARSLYLTAAHVVTDWVARFGETTEIWAVHAETGPKYSIWSVDCAWLNPLSDLALLHAKPLNDIAATDKEWPSLALDLAPPVVGERIVGFGHHSPTYNITMGQDGVRHIEVMSPGAATVGEVREVHYERRDGRLNFPCYRVNARFDGGMSGGPVLNDRGRVCGVICSNLPPLNEREEHASYATTLWPLMATQLTIGTNGQECEPYSLIELARRGIIQAHDHEHVQITKGTGSEPMRVEFRK